MKYTFNTLEEVKTAIEQWFKDCGYADNNNIDKQHNKILEELKELEIEIKNNDIEKCKDEAGDVFVTLAGVVLKQGSTLDIEVTNKHFYNNKEYNLKLTKNYINKNIYSMAFEYLNDLCKCLDIGLLECATIAYNKIQGRLDRGELSVKNGTVIKSGN